MQLKTLFRRTLISASLTGFILAGLATINSASLDKPSSTGPIEEFADADVATDYVAREQPPVGWVFGRMIGYPGADRPALSKSNRGVLRK